MKGAPTTSAVLRAFLFQGHRPLTLLAAGIALAPWGWLVSRNDVGGDLVQVLVLWLWVWGIHLALALCMRLVVAVACGLSARWVSWRVDRGSVVLTLVCTTLAGFLTLNGILSMPIAYSLFRQRGVPLLTTTGLGVLLVMGSLPLAALYVGQRWKQAPLKALRWAGLTLGCAGVCLGVAFRTAKPVNVDLDSLVIQGPLADVSHVVQGDRPKRVLLLGLDGMSWYLFRELLSQGKAPNLAGLLEVGTRANLGSVVPTLSASIWNTIATGRVPEDHGITGMTKYRLPGMTAFLKSWPRISSMNSWNGLSRVVDLLAGWGWVEEHQFHQVDRKVPALWDHALHHERSVGVVNWWATWPAPQMEAHSYMVAKPTKGAGAYSSAEVERIFGAAPAVAPVFGSESAVFSHKAAAGIWARTQREMSGANALFEAISPDLTLHYAHFVDGLQHRLWKGENPSHWHSGEASYPQALLDGYQQIDHWLGTHLEHLSEDTLVLFISDHGYSFDGHEHHFAPDGVFVAAGPGVKANHILDAPTIHDIAPTVLAALGLPVPETLEGDVLLDLFEPGVLNPVVGAPESSWFVPTEEAGLPDKAVSREELEFLQSLGYVN